MPAAVMRCLLSFRAAGAACQQAHAGAASRRWICFAAFRLIAAFSHERQKHDDFRRWRRADAEGSHCSALASPAARERGQADAALAL